MYCGQARGAARQFFGRSVMKTFTAGQKCSTFRGDEQSAISRVHFQPAARDELPDQALPFALLARLPDSVSAQLVVPRREDAFRCMPAQHIDNMTGAIALACLFDRRKRLLLRHRAVDEP